MKSNAVRYHWIDNIKVFALYLVVLGHVGTSPLHDIIYGFHMPLFFMLSGMLHKDKPVADIFKRLLVPYILFNVLYLALEVPWLYRQNGDLNFIMNDIRGIVFPVEHPIDYPTWFLLSLFEIKLIVKVLNGNTKWALVASISLIAMCWLFGKDIQAPFFMKNTLIGLCYYCLGYLLHRVFVHPVRGGMQYAVCIVGGVNTALYLIFMTQFDSCVWNEAIALPEQFVYSLLGCVGTVLLFKGCLNQYSSIIEKCSLGAIAIIGLHPLFLQYTRRFVLLFGGTWGNFPIATDMLIAAIDMLLCMLAIPLIVKYCPLLIGLKRKV